MSRVKGYSYKRKGKTIRVKGYTRPNPKRSKGVYLFGSRTTMELLRAAEMLRGANIPFQKTSSMGGGSILVSKKNLPRAKRILSGKN